MNCRWMIHDSAGRKSYDFRYNMSEILRFPLRRIARTLAIPSLEHGQPIVARSDRDELAAHPFVAWMQLRIFDTELAHQWGASPRAVELFGQRIVLLHHLSLLFERWSLRTPAFI